MKSLVIPSFDLYDAYYARIAALWEKHEKADMRERAGIVLEIDYLRERAYEANPLPADTLPNRTWNGKRTA
jgi:hypothetical protein